MTWTMILAIVVGSILQIVLGAVCGGYFVWRFRRGHGIAASDLRIVHLAGRINTLLHVMEGDVEAHHSEMDAIHQELSAATKTPPDSGAEFVLRIVGNILKSNERLQGRLHVAENKLQEQRTQLNAYLVKSQTDSLTKLPNRRAFEETLGQWMEQWRKRQREFGLIILDTDDLKAINDRGGHLTGDYMLRALGELLRKLLHSGEFVARMGGDEFVLLLPEPSLEIAQQRAEEIRRAVEKHDFLYEQRQWSITVSMGLAQIRPGEDDMDLIRRSDQALYAAKHTGRNCGFYHDGQACLPLPTDAEKNLVDEDSLLKLYEDLRKRVATVTEQT